jgi:hypothetical protein
VCAPLLSSEYGLSTYDPKKHMFILVDEFKFDTVYSKEALKTFLAGELTPVNVKYQPCKEIKCVTFCVFITNDNPSYLTPGDALYVQGLDARIQKVHAITQTPEATAAVQKMSTTFATANNDNTSRSSGVSSSIAVPRNNLRARTAMNDNYDNDDNTSMTSPPPTSGTNFDNFRNGFALPQYNMRARTTMNDNDDNTSMVSSCTSGTNYNNFRNRFSLPQYNMRARTAMNEYDDNDDSASMTSPPPTSGSNYNSSRNNENNIDYLRGKNDYQVATSYESATNDDTSRSSGVGSSFAIPRNNMQENSYMNDDDDTSMVSSCTSGMTFNSFHGNKNHDLEYLKRKKEKYELKRLGKLKSSAEKEQLRKVREDARVARLVLLYSNRRSCNCLSFFCIYSRYITYFI